MKLISLLLFISIPCFSGTSGKIIIYDADNNLPGVRHIVRAVYKKIIDDSNLEVDYKVLPLAQVHKKLRQDKEACSLAIVKGNNFAKNYKWITTYSKLELNLYKTTYAKTKSIALYANSLSELYAKKHNLEYLGISDRVQILKMLKNKRVDYLLELDAVVKNIQKLAKNDLALEKVKHMADFPVGIACHKEIAKNTAKQFKHFWDLKIAPKYLKEQLELHNFKITIN